MSKRLRVQMGAVGQNQNGACPPYETPLAALCQKEHVYFADFSIIFFFIFLYKSPNCSNYNLAARPKAALMLPKYVCTGTPHSSVVQTRVVVL